MISPKNVLNFLRCFQKGLLGKITPNLRAVRVEFQNDTTFELIFYYDKKISDEEQKLSSSAFKEVTSDYPPPDFNTALKIINCPYPKRIPGELFWLYERYEESYNPDK